MMLQVQIPDSLAAAAQRTATSVGMSCSKLVARALKAFLRSNKHVVRTKQDHPTGTHPAWAEDWAARGL